MNLWAKIGFFVIISTPAMAQPALVARLVSGHFKMVPAQPQHGHQNRLATLQVAVPLLPMRLASNVANPPQGGIDVDKRTFAAAPKDQCQGRPPLSVPDARALILDIAKREQFYPKFVASVAFVESHDVSNLVSDKGAYGLMQLMPDMATHYGVDRCDPAQNVLGGIRYLRDLQKCYANPFYILAAYNAGSGAVKRYGGLPPYRETLGYVAKVLDHYLQWPGPAGRSNPQFARMIGASAPVAGGGIVSFDPAIGSVLAGVNALAQTESSSASAYQNLSGMIGTAQTVMQAMDQNSAVRAQNGETAAAAVVAANQLTQANNTKNLMVITETSGVASAMGGGTTSSVSNAAALVAVGVCPFGTSGAGTMASPASKALARPLPMALRRIPMV